MSKLSYVKFIYEGSMLVLSEDVYDTVKLTQHISENIPACPVRIEIVGISPSNIHVDE